MASKLPVYKGFKALPPRKEFSLPYAQGMTIGMMSGQWPSVTLTHRAHSKMWALVKECDIEVGWLATCTKDKDGYVIDDVYVPKQECTMASTNMTEDGQSEMLTELMEEKKFDVIKNLNCWGHSHVDMAVFASGVDSTQTDKFISDSKSQKHDHFIRIIANKKGEFFCTLYLFKNNILINNPRLVNLKDPKDTTNYKAWAKKEISDKVTKELIRHTNFSGSYIDAGWLECIDDWFQKGHLSKESYDFYQREKLKNKELENVS